MQSDDVYISLFKATTNVITNIIEAGQYVIELFCMNQDTFDPNLMKLGIDLKSARFLYAIASDFTTMYPEMIEKYELQKAVILASIGYPKMQQMSFPITPLQIKEMKPEELIRYIFEHGLIDIIYISIPYIKQLATLLAIKHPTGH
ncbi:hypothetical protein JW960_14490 [candidate division KSB1 bacterium]|nr:hypothetical protein [candidate division KSB1 bacterium]